MKVLVQPRTTRWRRWPRCSSLRVGQNLEEEFGAAAVEFHVAEFVDAEQVDAAVAGDLLLDGLLASLPVPPRLISGE